MKQETAGRQRQRDPMVPARYSMPTTRNTVVRSPIATARSSPVLARPSERGGIGDLIVVLLVEDLVASHHEGLLLAAFNVFDRDP
jgi:hypothetical protein